MLLWRFCWWFGRFIGLIDGTDKLISLHKILAGLIKIFLSKGLIFTWYSVYSLLKIKHKNY